MRIFLSHNSNSKPFIREFRQLLPRFLDTWLDEEHLSWGESFPDQLQYTIQTHVDFLIIFLDKNALISDWVKQELEWALEREKELGRVFVLPVLLEDIMPENLPIYLQDRQQLRLKNDYRHAAVKALAEQTTLELFKLVTKSFVNFNKHTSNQKYFAICIPTGDPDADEFNSELKCYLMEKLITKGITPLDYCPRIDLSDKNQTLINFREKIDELVTNERPNYLLVIWPGLSADANPHLVIERLKMLAKIGCRIGFINEFPKIDQQDKEFVKKVAFFCFDDEKAINLLCNYLKGKKSGNILLIHASQGFETARKRKKLYEQAMADYKFTFKSIEIESWDAAQAKTAVLNELEQIEEWKHYDIIAAANDKMAIGAAAALREFSSKNRMDLPTKVIGFDGMVTAINMIKAADTPLIATIAATPRKYVSEVFSILSNPAHEPDGQTIMIPVDNPDLKTKDQC